MAYMETGSKELAARLDAIRKEMTTNASRKAVRSGGKVIQAAMTERAPVKKIDIPGGNSLPQGKLKSDMRVNVSMVEGQPVASIGPGKETAHVARWVEYGHRMVSGGSSSVVSGTGKTRGPGKAKAKDVPAYPFLRPAYEASEGEAVEAMNATLAEELRKVT